MKKFVLDYSLNVLVAFIALILISQVFDIAKGLYYSQAPLDNFYQRGDFIALDVCVGDENQSIISSRVVRGTENGYPAVVNRELFTKSGQKVYEETATPFVDVAGNGESQRIQRLPTWLAEGEYYWILYIRLNINGAERDVIPPLVSTHFKITNCN